MSFKELTVLAVVPARGGSKGIPRKNLQLVAGKSLVALAGKVVQALPWIDRAIVSTDSDEIAAEGMRHGLLAPFLRSPELASDKASSIDMWRDAWLSAEKYFNTRFEISVLLEPTSPLRRPADVERVVAAMIDGGHGAAATVSRTPAHFTPEKTLKLDAAGKVGFYLAEGSRFACRQGIPPYYHRNGVCYAVRRNTLIERGSIIDYDCLGIVIDRDVVNIDDFLDLRVANLLASDENGAVR